MDFELLLHRHLHEKERKGQVIARDSVWRNATGKLETEGLMKTESTGRIWNLKIWWALQVTEVCCEEWEGGFRQRHHTWRFIYQKTNCKRQETRGGDLNGAYPNSMKVSLKAKRQWPQSDQQIHCLAGPGRPSVVFNLPNLSCLYKKLIRKILHDTVKRKK